MFLSTFNDDLRCLFFLFFLFVVLLTVGLARDGCLVRSWFGVAQRGGAAGRRERVVTDLAKPISTNPARGVGVILSLAKLKTRVKSLD